MVLKQRRPQPGPQPRRRGIVHGQDRSQDDNDRTSSGGEFLEREERDWFGSDKSGGETEGGTWVRGSIFFLSLGCFFERGWEETVGVFSDFFSNRVHEGWVER